MSNSGFSGAIIRLAVAIKILGFATPALAADGFRELTARLDHEVHATPLNFQVPGGAGLLAVGENDHEWRYSVIALDDGEILATGAIPPAAFFYDAGDPMRSGNDRLCFLTASGVAALDVFSGDMTQVLAIDSVYRGVPAKGPSHKDFVRKVGDEDNLILAPVFDGWLLARSAESDFDRFPLEIPPRVTVFDARVTYWPRTPQIGDVDGDGASDIVYLVDRDFVSFLQQDDGRFATTGRRDFIDAPLATEKQRARWQRDDGQVDQSDLAIEEVELVKDFNGDDVLDLLTDKEISEGVLDRRSEYHLYLGRRQGDALTYSAVPDGSIVSDGVQFEPLVVDVDGDELLDLATPSTKLGLGRIIGALFSGRMSVDLDVYRMRDDGSYPEKSDYQTRFKVEFDLKTGLSRYPAVTIADFDGDNLAELLVQEEHDELTLYPGIGADGLFGDDTRTLAMPLPRNGQMVKARDLDDDGRTDLLVRYGPADGENRVRELRILLSTPEDTIVNDE